jgi:septal ring-binding cell division protein DamX
MTDTELRERPAPATACPTCGAPAERGQLICLECGSRIALAYRRPPSWRVPAAIVTVVLLAVAAGAVFAIRALTDDAKDEVASQPAPAQPAEERPNRDDDGAAPGGNDDEGERPADENRPADEDEDADAAPGGLPVGSDGVRAWPEGEDGFTVVVLSSEDRASARAFARQATQQGVKAGVLRADDYPALSASTGFFIVFVGRYANQAGADRAAARLQRNYQGAYPQFVDGSKSKRPVAAG